jgi:hypothetical protein
MGPGLNFQIKYMVPLITPKEEKIMLCSIATHMNESTLQTIKELEKDLGKTLLAFKCHDLRPSMLSAEQLRKLQEIENNLGISLVAVEQ